MKIFQKIPSMMAIATALAFIVSCEGPEGPAGPAGPAGAKGDKGDTGAVGSQGPAGVGVFKILDFTFQNEEWEPFGEEGDPDYSLYYVRSIPELTPSIVSNGAVLAFVELFSDGEFAVWTPLPYTTSGLGDEEDVLSYLSYIYSTYNPQITTTNFQLETFDSDRLFPLFGNYDLKIRLVIINGSASGRINFEELKGMSYEELERVLENL